MPSGTIHLKLNSIVGIPILAGIGAFAPSNEMALSIGSGYVIGSILMTPDLDTNGADLNEKNAVTIFGVFGNLWKWFWLPYAKIANHRGLSHAPLVGSFLRAIYLGIPAGFLFLWQGWGLPSGEVLFALWLGTEFASLIHIIADRYGSF